MKINKWMLYLGGAAMIITGLSCTLESYVSVGLGLIWIANSFSNPVK